MSQQPFSESVKVVDLLQRPFAQLPMSSDLPRLTNIRVVDEKGRSEYEQPAAAAPTLAKLRYTFVALTALLLDDKAVEMTKKTFDEHFAEGLDVSKLSMESFLVKIGGDASPVVQVLKAVNQSAISPAIIHLKLKLGLVNMTKDVRDSWFYEVIVSASTGQVVVASHKRDQSIKNEFQYEWVMAVHFDKVANPEENIEIQKLGEVSASTKDIGITANELSSSSSSSTAPIAIANVKTSSSPVASPRSNSSPKPSSSPTNTNPSTTSTSPTTQPQKLSKRQRKRRNKQLNKEGSASSATALQSTDSQSDLESSTSHSMDERGSHSEDEVSDEDVSKDDHSGDSLAVKSKVVVSGPPSRSASWLANNSATGTTTTVGDTDIGTDASIKTASILAHSDSEHANTNSSESTSVAPNDESLANGATHVNGKNSTSSTSNGEAPSDSNTESETYFANRRFDFSYKCTNASLSVTDLMFSLALHTSNQAKRAEISKILEPYSTTDVLDLSHSRNWEFFPASASAEVAVSSSSTAAAASGTPLTVSSSSIASTPRQSLQESEGSSTPLSAASGSGSQIFMLGGSSSSINPNHTPSPPVIVQGVKEYDNGDLYEGGLCLGIREGHGKYTCKTTGVVYEGGYKDGKRHGKGNYEFSTGAKVSGTFQRGVLVHGEYSFPNGDLYVGDFKDDKFDGQGEWKGANGDLYKGAWKSGMRHGLGEAKLKHGDIYTGEFLNDAIHGFGKYLFSNGDLFNGQFAAGLIHGVGEYTFAASGKQLLGEFALGKLIKSSSITNNPPSSLSLSSSSSTAAAGAHANTSNNASQEQNSTSSNNSSSAPTTSVAEPVVAN
jgi:hypothetical protein